MTQDLLSIDYELKPGGTSHGITTYTKLLECTRRTKLDKIRRSQGLTTSSDSWEAEVGTLLHVFRELYYKHEIIDPWSVQLYSMHNGERKDFVWPNGNRIHDKQLKEACDLFNAYRLLHPRPWGRILEVEIDLPRNESEKQWIEKAVGLSPYTCRLDTIQKLSQKDCDRILQEQGISIEPGVWIEDLKTYGGYENPEEQYRHSTSMTAYYLAAQAVGYKPKGSLITVLHKSKPVRVQLIAKRGVSKLDLKIFDSTIESINKRLSDDQLKDEPINNYRCYWPRRCLHDVTGDCTHY